MRDHKTITDALLPHAEKMDAAFKEGAKLGFGHAAWMRIPWEVNLARALFSHERVAEGFKDRVVPLLTPPSANAKLTKGETPSYGLTLQHTLTRIRKGLVVNACPHAGDCQRVCVLDNGNGAFDKVQRARRAKTRFLVNQPQAFALLLGYELAQALNDHLAIHWRPNTNSDIRWEELIPSAFDGSVLGIDCYAYDYGKDPERILPTDGWLASFYRVAYSANETSSVADMAAFLDRGGSVALVTSRKKGEPVVHRPFGEWLDVKVLDADLTDEWMFEPGTIGDLSAKGRARKLIGQSGFIHG